MLKVSPQKGVIRFGKRGKLNPQYIRSFKILKRVGPVAYTLELPEELNNVHSTFYISNLKKCLSEESLVIPMKELLLDDKLNFVEEPIEIIDREVKQMRQSRIPIVKVRWNSERGPEFTWEREDQIRAKSIGINESRLCLPVHEVIKRTVFENNRQLWQVTFPRGHLFLNNVTEVNLTAPTLTFPSIEAHELYSIVDKPSTGLIYLNSKDEKRVMYLTEIVKFCDATLEKVLKEVKLKIFQSEMGKPPLLGELDCDILRAFEREITKRLSHREQMRRWESFVNGRPILPTIKHLY
ncbi:hypothetical protein Tco_1504443 [Tanacetum coccineum]